MHIRQHILFFTAILLSTPGLAQTAKKNSTVLQKKESENRFSIALGGNLSSVNLSRNYRENPYKIGFDARAYYDVNSVLRVMSEYSFTPKFDLGPTWYDVHNQIFNVSVNAMAYTRSEDLMVYTISGLCIQRWKGFYTGQFDFSSAKFFYQPNSIVLNKTLGLDLGLGFEKPLPGFSLYGDFRYRFARLDHSFGITDAAYNLGLKFTIFKEDLKKSKDRKSKNKARRHRKSDKYHWF
ncbi:MAG: hypothetical protein K0S33_1893 [Bacteroidetes bacterium]|jgi:hypothetical protein|nr:hypothetical protein [Bacteroidota bacterium]